MKSRVGTEIMGADSKRSVKRDGLFTLLLSNLNRWLKLVTLGKNQKNEIKQAFLSNTNANIPVGGS